MGGVTIWTTTIMESSKKKMNEQMFPCTEKQDETGNHININAILKQRARATSHFRLEVCRAAIIRKQRSGIFPNLSSTDLLELLQRLFFFFFFLHIETVVVWKMNENQVFYLLQACSSHTKPPQYFFFITPYGYKYIYTYGWKVLCLDPDTWPPWGRYTGLLEDRTFLFSLLS